MIARTYPKATTSPSWTMYHTAAKEVFFIFLAVEALRSINLDVFDSIRVLYIVTRSSNRV